MDGGEGDDYGGLQQPAGGYADAGVADAPTDYGDVQNPPSPYDTSGKKPVPPPKPPVKADPKPPVKADPIEQVKSDVTLAKVKLDGLNLINMKRHRNGAAFESKFDAWTNSSTDIYVNVQPLLNTKKNPNDYNNARAGLVVAVIHEIVHVIQFKNNKRHPKTFQQMIEFESDAYSKSVAWMDDPNNYTYLTDTKKIGATTDSVDGMRDSLAKEKTAFEARTKVKVTKDDDNRTWLTGNDSLPKTIKDKAGNDKADYTVDDLYETP